MDAHRTRPYIFLVALIVLGGLLAGCAGSKSVVDRPPTELPPGFPNHSARFVQRAVAATADSLDAFEASGRLELHRPDDRSAYKAHVQQRANDSLLVSLSPGWGIVAARALATHDSVFVYDRFHHRLYYGTVGNVQRVLPELASVSTLFNNLTGTVVPADRRRWRIRADSSRYILTAEAGFRQYRAVVEPRMWRVVRYEVRTRDGTMIETREFSDFRRIDGVYMPHRIEVHRPRRKTRLIVEYDSIQPNPGALAFSFPVAPGAERIPLMQEVQ